MNRREVIARLLVGIVLVGVPTGLFAYQLQRNDDSIIDIRASAPEVGGFGPDAVRVSVGEPVTLRFTSQDVVHGIAIGPGLDVDLGDIDPGKSKTVTLTFDESGTYTFYCTTWCSPDHWRMRGVIEVYDPQNPNYFPPAQPDPVIAALIEEGVNIDVIHNKQAHDELQATQAIPPSPERGESIIDTLTVPTEMQTLEWQRIHTPVEAVHQLKVSNPYISEGDLVDAVAYLWTQNIATEQLANTETLYNQNCAVCHGQFGGGDGPAAGLTAVSPAVFANAEYMFTMRSDVLYAKIWRGGMGTDMPNFGTLLTPEETWALVDYLWAFMIRPE